MQEVIETPGLEAPEESLEGFPLSPQQRRAWEVLEGGPGASRLRGRLILGLRGKLRGEALAAAWGDVLARHEILRTRFARLPGMTLPVQVIDLPASLPWTEIPVAGSEEGDLVSALLAADEAAGAEAGDSLLEESPRRIFLASGASTPDGGSEGHALLISLSPLVADGRTLSNLAREIPEAYGNRLRGEGAAGENEPPMQYADFAQWLSDGLESEEGADGRDFWAALEIPADAPSLALLGAAVERTEGPAGERGLAASKVQDMASLESLVRELALEQEVAPEAVLSTACQALLHRFSREGNPVIWGALDGRGYEELEAAAGPFRSFAPLTLPEVGGTTFLERLRNVAEAWEERTLWQEYLDPAALASSASPSTASVQLEESPGSLPRSWAFESAPRAGESEVEGLTFRTLEQDAPAERSQLRWLLEGPEPSFEMRLVYDPAFLDEAAAQRLTRSFRALLEDALRHPNRPLESLSLLSSAERGEILDRWHGDRGSRREGMSLLDGIARRSREAGHAVALVQGTQELTYGELWARAGAIAGHLSGLGLPPASRVGLCLRRGTEMVAAILGILRGGYSYVALSPDHPAPRLQGLLSDAAPALVLCSSGTVGSFGEIGTPEGPAGPSLLCLEEIAAPPGEELRSVPADPLQLAYLVYTSGSTGKPKGIEVSRGSVDGYLAFLDEFLQLGPEDKVLQLPDLIYDASVRDLMTPLLAGARVVLVSDEESRDPGALLDLIHQQRVTALLSVVPTVLRSLLAAARERPGDWSSVHTVLSSGEKLFQEDVAHARALFGERTRVVNLYGPSECTMTSTFFPVPEGENAPGLVPIGRPITGSGLVVVDEGLRLRPPGLVGEACIAGGGLARGYLADPAKTAASFVPDPFSKTGGERLFRTGDEVVLRGADELEILGRRDGQIKVRGIRVEVGEIEAALRRLPGVREAAVGVHGGGSGPEGALVAWVVPEDPLAGVPEEQRYRLPNGLPIRHLNRYETDFFYQQIFVDEVDVRNGLDLAAGDVVFDVGANIGLFSLYAHLAHPGIRIFAFEPIPETCSVLRSNLELYGAEARIEACGLSSRSGSVEFAYYPLSSCQSGYYPDEAQERRMLEAIIERQTEDREALSVAGDYFAGVVDQRMQRQVLQCPLKTVSQVLEEQGLERIDLLKIDVEKSELDVLRGIRDEDWPKIRQVSIEAHDLDGRLREMTDLLEARGYRLTVEQEDALLDDTCLFNIYATRSAAEERRPAELALPQHLVEGEVSPEGLRRSLRQVLPEALVPNLFVSLSELPRTSGGKIDRRSLPDPETRAVTEAPRSLRVATPAEEIIRETMASVLGLDEVSTEDDFFALGGHSLLGTQLILRINQAFGVSLPLQRLFESPKVRELAVRVEEAARERRGLKIPPLVQVSRDQDLPLSFAQQRLWLVDQMEPGGSIFNLPGAVRIRGPLHPGILDRAIGELVRRHETLRTTFRTNPGGEPFQVIAPAGAWISPRVDLGALAEGDRAAQLELLRRAADQLPFDLELGPIFRSLIFRLGPAEHVVHFNLHHIAGDAWSVGVLVGEVTALFEAAQREAPAALPELPVQYGDYAHWQRSWLRGETLEALAGAWLEHLAGAPPVIDLPRDGGGGKSAAGGSLDLELPPELTTGLHQLNRSQHTSLFMTLLAVFDVTLHSYSGAEDLVVGGDIAHRSRLETEGLIGFFINQIVLRVSLAGDPSFSEILRRARKASLFAYEHQDLPFDKLVEALNPDRGTDHAPVFQVKLVVQNTPPAAMSLGPDLEAEAMPVASRPAREELLLNAVPSGDGLALRFKYNDSVFSASTLRRLAGRFRRTLELAVEDPERSLSALVSSLEEAERAEKQELAAQRGSALGSKLKSRRRSGRGAASKTQGER